MPGDTRLRSLCWNTSLQASIKPTNKVDGSVENDINLNTNTNAPVKQLTHINVYIKETNGRIGKVEQYPKATFTEIGQPHVHTSHYG